MNFVKSLIATGLLGLASLGAQAVPLDSITGPTEWKLQGTTTEFHSGGGFGNESTWGIGEVTQILDGGGNSLWFGGATDGSHLYFMLYGIADLSIIARPGPTFDIYNIGCVGGPCDGKIHLDVYKTSGPIANILSQAPTSRSGFGAFSGLTDFPGSSLYLSLELVDGKVLVNDGSTAADETTATLFQTTTAQTLPTAGTGTFFSEVVGGTAAAQWNTNTVAAGSADFDSNFTLVPHTCTAAGNTAGSCFAGKVNDPITGFAAPEPGSLALFGVMLAGLALVGRRRKN